MKKKTRKNRRAAKKKLRLDVGPALREPSLARLHEKIDNQDATNSHPAESQVSQPEESQAGPNFFDDSCCEDYIDYIESAKRPSGQSRDLTVPGADSITHLVANEKDIPCKVTSSVPKDEVYFLKDDEWKPAEELGAKMPPLTLESIMKAMQDVIESNNKELEKKLLSQKGSMSESGPESDRPSEGLSGDKNPSKGPQKGKKPNNDDKIARTLSDITASIAAINAKIDTLQAEGSLELGAEPGSPVNLLLPKEPYKEPLGIGRRQKLDSPKKLLEAVNDYFKTNQEDVRETERIIKGEVVKIKQRKPLTMAGLARHLGIGRNLLNSYTNTNSYRKWQKEDPGKAAVFKDIITRARLVIEEDNLSEGLLGNHNPNLSILNLSSNYGYSNKIEQETKSKWEVTVNRVSYKGASGIDFDEVKQKQIQDASHIILDVDPEGDCDFSEE